MSQEANVIQLLREKGRLKIDDLVNEYRKRFSQPLIYDGKLTTWVITIEGVSLSSRGNISIQNGQHIDKYELVNQVGEDVQVISNRVVQLVQERGSLWQDLLKQEYQERFSRPLKHAGKQSEWLKTLNGITLKNGVIYPSSAQAYQEHKNEHTNQNRSSVEQSQSNENENTVNSDQDQHNDVVFIDSADKVPVIAVIERMMTSHKKFVVVLHTELFENLPDLFCIGIGMTCIIFDYKNAGDLMRQKITELLDYILCNQHIWKIATDITLCPISTEHEMFKKTIDLLIVSELWSGKLTNTLPQALERCKVVNKRIQVPRLILSEKRPVPQKILNDCASRVCLAVRAAYLVVSSLKESDQKVLERATGFRHQAKSRDVWFDENDHYKLISLALLRAKYPKGVSTMPTMLKVEEELDDLLNLLSEDLQKAVWKIGIDGLSEFVFDIGREPICWKHGKRFILADDLIDDEAIRRILSELGDFGNDNRAGLERQLHRISCIRSRSDDILGLTLRVGRHVTGNADMIADLLLGTDKSILFLGEPGCGKTTIVRGATELLAREKNVYIVDTSNEIAGDGVIPHSCVGYARRMMVKSLNDQANVMVECVQNHTPEVMVIDEIGRPLEVDAAMTCKQRGVRMIASAHGDLRKLVKNKKLRGLVGGVESVTLGDQAAREEGKKNNLGSLVKVKAQRGGEAVFDIIVELYRGRLHEWFVVMNAGEAVDIILEMGLYEVQRRVRNPQTGSFMLFEELR